ncbi:MAG: hypothetical protein IJT20_03945 [Synergistaceae bacterium]|nr:hypothetical protein [Synergistaceae bacterium]
MKNLYIKMSMNLKNAAWKKEWNTPLSVMTRERIILWLMSMLCLRKCAEI